MRSFCLHIFRFILILILGSLIPQKSYATHIVGGTMTYECLGNNFYTVTLTVYRDCNGSGFDTNAPIGIYDGNGNLISVELVPFQGATHVPIILNNPCLITPPNVCIEKTDYVFSVNLPPNTSGYELVYQRCCRNGNAINVVNPLTVGSTYKTYIPGSAITCNNSPVFNNPPPTIMCVGYPFNYDLSASDADGDSLFYCFSDAIAGASQQNPAPTIPIPSPHINVPWNNGYSTNYQIASNPQFTIDGQTGFLTGTPTTAGFFTFCVKIKEYRNGVLIDEVYRDFLLTITTCNSNTVADFPAQSDYCFGTTIVPNNNSLNASYYYWDFGDPSTNIDTSTLSHPIYTYTDTGLYNIMLVANPGYSCADTIYQQFRIYPEINPSFTSPNDQCLLNNSFTFNAQGINYPDDTITWDFGNTANPGTIVGPIAVTSFSATGVYPIELKIQNFGCTGVFHDTVEIHSNPIANFPPQSVFCNGYNVQFGNNSTNASNYFWDFGDGSNSNINSPLHNYPDSGIYEVSLVASQQNICYDTTSHNFHVYPPLIGEFPSQSAQCLPNNLFTLNATGNFNNVATINWNFGSLGNPVTSTVPQTQVSFQSPGFHEVTLTINNYGCSSSYTDTLHVFPTPIFDFTLAADTGCQPFTAAFIDQSFSWTPISYHWDFGDNNTSTSSSPQHTYMDHGVYDVTVTLSTDSGCIDTITKLIPNLITVLPKPESKFMINPIETYFLNHEIIAFDQSNELYHEFFFGDGNSSSNRYVKYSYLDTGHYMFEQIVMNEFTCKDTSSQQVWIVPDFLFYVPNSFTPDGDNLNDVFLPQIQGIIEYELQLFNRWGELFFSTKTLTEGWDGTYNGIPCPVGVYNWRIKVKTIDHKIHKQVGHLNLFR